MGLFKKSFRIICNTQPIKYNYIIIEKPFIVNGDSSPIVPGGDVWKNSKGNV